MSWQQVPLRRIFRIVNGGTPTSDEEYWDGDVPWATPVDVGNVNGSYLATTQRNLSDEGVRTGSRTVPGGSLVISTRAPIGYIAQATRPMAFNQGCRGLVPVVETDPRYFRYQLLMLREELSSRGAGSTFMELSTDALAAVPVALPPVDEQRRIADFLDTETARIDDLVLLRTSQVTTLSDALHSEASRLTGRHQVCRDRLPSLRRMPLRRIVEDVQTGLTPTELLQPIGNPGVVPWYTPAALKGMLELGAPEKGIQQEVARSVPRFQAGSILLVGIGESLGKVADLDHEATGNQQLTAITTYDSIDRRFLAWQLVAAHEEIRAWAQYSRIRILNNDNLKAFPVLVPSLADQLAARKELDDRLAQLREFGSAAARFSSRAAERRQALITAAVTGQIDVTTARGVAT